MRVVHSDASLLNAIGVTQAEALAAFSNDQVYMENFSRSPGTLNFRFWPTTTATSCIWANAIAPCRGATRK